MAFYHKALPSLGRVSAHLSTGWHFVQSAKLRRTDLYDCHLLRRKSLATISVFQAHVSFDAVILPPHTSTDQLSPYVGALLLPISNQRQAFYVRYLSFLVAQDAQKSSLVLSSHIDTLDL